MTQSIARVFGADVALPPGWQDETVHLFAAPTASPTTKGGRAAPAKSRATITAARLRAASLDAAIEALGPLGALDQLTVLADELKLDADVKYYERIARFAEPATGAPVQQSARVYHRGDAALVLVFTCAAIEFNDAYGAFANVAKQAAAGFGGAS
jgi:hypothetical protein